MNRQNCPTDSVWIDFLEWTPIHRFKGIGRIQGVNRDGDEEEQTGGGEESGAEEGASTGRSGSANRRGGQGRPQQVSRQGELWNFKVFNESASQSVRNPNVSSRSQLNLFLHQEANSNLNSIFLS